MDVVPRLTADFPNPVVGIGPGETEQIPDFDNPALRVAVHGVARFNVEGQGVQHLAVHVELLLLRGGIAETDRLRSPVAFEKRPGPLRNRGFPVQRVQDL